MRQIYANHGAKWTGEDDEKLWNLFVKKTTIDELAKLFNRSKRSIELRLRKLEQEMNPLTQEVQKNEYNKASGQNMKLF